MERRGNRKSSEGSSVHLKNLYSLLSSLNPKKKSIIDLSDMVLFIQKNLLKRVPLPYKAICQGLFHDFIFSHKSFKLPFSTLVSMLKLSEENKSTPAEETEIINNDSEHKKTTYKKSCNILSGTPFIEKNIKKLGLERNYIVYDQDFLEGVKLSVDCYARTTRQFNTPKHQSSHKFKYTTHDTLSYNEINNKKKETKKNTIRRCLHVQKRIKTKLGKKRLLDKAKQNLKLSTLKLKLNYPRHRS